MESTYFWKIRKNTLLNFFPNGNYQPNLPRSISHSISVNFSTIVPKSNYCTFLMFEYVLKRT